MADEKDDGEFDLVRLDRQRHFSTVFPPENGAHFFQDGLHFGADGRLAEEWLTEKDKARVRNKVARARAEEAANKARNEALRKAGIDPTAKDPEAPAPTKREQKAAESAADAAAIDLKAWARGEVKVTWFKVKQAFLTQHSREVENKEDALIFLADEGLISADEVGV